jgi:cytochrome c553
MKVSQLLSIMTYLNNEGFIMKKSILLSLVTASVLFTGCGEETKKAVTEASASMPKTVKETTTEVAKATQERAVAATEVVKETTVKDVESAKEAVVSDERPAVEPEHKTEATPAKVAPAAIADNTTGKAAFAKCAGCHGVDGKTKALGKSEILAGQSATDLESKIAAYKAGTRNVAGMGMLMKGQVASMDEATIKAVSEYISGL